MAVPATCFVCAAALGASIEAYVTCPNCGHRQATGHDPCGVVVNERLERDRAMRPDALTRAQLKLVMEVAVARGSLLDIGCGTGKFLYHARACFDRVLGVEAGDASVRFATTELGLEVVKDVASATGPFDVITSWHALEHIPGPVLDQMLSDLRARCHNNTQVIICVPNPDSWPAEWLGPRWAFRDVGAHLHEFSRRSLDAVFRRTGFQPAHTHRLFAYTLFAWVQSLANFSPLPHNYLYYRLKRGWTFGRGRLALVVGDVVAALWLLPGVSWGGALALLEHALA